MISIVLHARCRDNLTHVAGDIDNLKDQETVCSHPSTPVGQIGQCNCLACQVWSCAQRAQTLSRMSRSKTISISRYTNTHSHPPSQPHPPTPPHTHKAIIGIKLQAFSPARLGRCWRTAPGAFRTQSRSARSWPRTDRRQQPQLAS